MKYALLCDQCLYHYTYIDEIQFRGVLCYTSHFTNLINHLIGLISKLKECLRELINFFPSQLITE